MLPIMIPGLLIGVSLLVLLHRDAAPAALDDDGRDRPERVHDAVRDAARGGEAAGLRPLARARRRDLGANAFQRLRLIVLPLLLPAILAGALFAFTLSLDEFIITYFLVGTNITLPIYIYTQVKYGITPEVNALASMLLAASLTLLAPRVRAAPALPGRAARREAPGGIRADVAGRAEA